MSIKVKNALSQGVLLDEKSLAYQKCLIRYISRQHQYSFVGIILKLIRRSKEQDEGYKKNPTRINFNPPRENSRQHVSRLGNSAVSGLYRQKWTLKRRFKSYGFGFVGGRYILQ